MNIDDEISHLKNENAKLANEKTRIREEASIANTLLAESTQKYRHLELKYKSLRNKIARLLVNE